MMKASNEMPLPTVYSGRDCRFWFSSDLADWMPKFREEREAYKLLMRGRRKEKGLRAVKLGNPRFGGKLKAT